MIRLGLVWLAVAACGQSPSPAPSCEGPDCPCAAGTDRCGGDVCIDIASDPLNCGACGHDCLGAACSAGACQPEPITTVPGTPAAMVLHDDDIVFATNAQIASSGVLYRVPRSGGDPTAIYRDLGADAALAIDNGRIIVADSGQVEHCRLDVGGGSILSIDAEGDVNVLSRRRTCARDLNPHASGLFWLDNHVTESFPRPTGMFLPFGGSADAEPGNLPSPLDHPLQLSLVDQTLVWSGTTTQAILSMPVGGETPMTIMDLPRPNVWFATGAGKIAFQTFSPAGSTEDIAVLEVRGLFTSESHSMPLPFETFEAPRLQLVDENFVYMSTGNEIWVADPVARTSRVFASLDQEFLPEDQILVQDETFVYALTRYGSNTRVVRIRKPATAAPFPVPLECRGPLQQCAGSSSCSDTSTDLANCGGCGQACGIGEICEQSQCTCELVCDLTCVDPMTDRQHCGACGNQCLDACIGGVCEPFGVALANIGNAAQDTSAVYFQEGVDLKRFDKQTLTTSFLRTFHFPKSVAVDDSQIYVLETPSLSPDPIPGTVHAVSKDGQTITPLYVDRPDPATLVAADNALVWMENAGPFSPTPLPATLAIGAKDGSALHLVTPVGLYAGAASDRHRAVTTDGTTAYWLVSPTDPEFQPCRTTTSIVRVDLATTPPTTSLLAQIPGEPAGSIAILGNNVYVATCNRIEREKDFTMFAIPKTGGSPRKIATLDVSSHSGGGRTESIGLDGSSGRLRWIDGWKSVRELDPTLEIPRTIVGDLIGAGLMVEVDDGFLVMAAGCFFFVQH